MNILTLNAGSSSIKYKLFKVIGSNLTANFSGLIEGIGEPIGRWTHTGKDKNSQEKTFKNHQNAFEFLATKLEDELDNESIDGIGHRVVHGGNKYYKPTVINEDVLKDIEKLSILAPIHNPVNAMGIKFAMEYFHDALEVAVFDTGFHHNMPEMAYKYAIDQEVANKYSIRRYGFHGLNHEYVAQQAAKYLRKPLTECNFITLHLGNGASACLIKHGLSFDTSMGMTPLAGLIMGTRCGNIDPAIPLYLQEQGFTANEVDKLLNKKSGLMGIAGDNDMRNLTKRAQENDIKAQLAIDMYVYSIQKTIGSLISQTTELDALIFTGGIGENAANIREAVVKTLNHFGLKINDNKNESGHSETSTNISGGKIPILVIKGNEELFIAEKVMEIMK